MEYNKLKKIICGHQNVNVQNLQQLNVNLREETTNTHVVNDLTRLIPAVYKYAVNEDKKLREAALPALTELAGLLDLNKHLKEKEWWTEMKATIETSVDVLMNLVSTGDYTWAQLWVVIVTMLGTDLRAELTLLNRLLKVAEKAFKMNDEEVRHQGFECWCKLIDNFSINRNEINNKRRLNLLVIPLKANNHNTQRLCISKMKTWEHLLSKLDQHNEMTVQLLVTHFLEFMFRGVGSIAPACKSLNTKCAALFLQLLRTPLLFRILPQLLIKYTFVCIEHIHRDSALSLSVWEGLLENLKINQWTEENVSELLTEMTNASKTDVFGKSKTFANMVRTLYRTLPSDILVKNLKTFMSLALEPHVLVNSGEDWYTELLSNVSETNPIQLPQNIVGDIIAKLNVLVVSELFRDEKLKCLRGIWMALCNIICKWMTDDGQIGKNGNIESDLQNIHQLLFFGAAPLSSTWSKLQMKSWKSLYSECVKYFSLSTEVKCEKFVGELVDMLVEGVKDKKIPVHIAMDLVQVILELHLSKDESSILPLMLEVAVSTMTSFQNETISTFALLNQYLKIILAAARSEPALVNGILTVTDKMLTVLEDVPLSHAFLEKTKNAIMKANIQLNALKPCRNQDRSESPGTNNTPPATSPTMTSFLHRLAKSKETKSKLGSPTPSQCSDVSSSPIHTPTSKKCVSPFGDLKSEDFVFVPPKSRKILLTEHQKESLATRKHDIPALYQDLSQDSSQATLESIVTPVHTGDKEQKTVKAAQSPQSFKDLNLSLSPKKSNLRSSSSEDKLQNNKENDCFNNNKKPPTKTNAKELKISLAAEEVPMKVSLEDKKSLQDHVTENMDETKVTPTNTRMKLRKSLSVDLGSKQETNNTKKDGNNGSTNLLKDRDISLNDVKHENGIDQDMSILNSNGVEKETTENLVQDVLTPKKSVEGQTPKTSLRKTKLNISIEKSGKKRGRKSKKEEGELVNGTPFLSTPNSSNKSNNITTPKVSPRRLRKRKSGVTPVLSGGEYVKKINENSQSPLSSKKTPTNKKSVNNDTLVSAEKEKVNEIQTLIDGCKEIIKTKQSEEETENGNMKIQKIEEDAENGITRTKETKEETTNGIKGSTKSEFKNTGDHVEPATKNKDKFVKIVPESNNTKKENTSAMPVVENTEMQPKTVAEVDDEIIVVGALTNNETKINATVDDSKSLMITDNVCNPLKTVVSIKNDKSCTDIACSPVKVVVERLPEIMISADSLEQLQIRTESDKKRTPVKNFMSSVSDSNPNSTGTVGAKRNLESAISIDKAITLEENDNMAEPVSIPNEIKEDLAEPKASDVILSNPNTPSKFDSGKTSSSYESTKSLRGRSSTERAKTSSSDKNKDIGCIGITENTKTLPENTAKSNKATDHTNSTDEINNQAKKTSALQPDVLEKDTCDERSTPSKKKPVLKPASGSASRLGDANESPSGFKLESTENTPGKSGQKQLKQTQLPFTPIRKTEGTRTKSESNEKVIPAPKLTEIDGKSLVLVLEKINSPKNNTLLQNSHSKTLNDESSLSDGNKSSIEGFESKESETTEFEDKTKALETRQEVQRTPEKANKLPNVTVCLDKTDIDARIPPKIDSPSKVPESEDIIASSQETNVSTQSILLSYKNSSINNSSKLSTKSPKKCENPTQSIISSERVLRSSPTKTENTRFTVTPVKKSVCRRLDVEIEESIDSDEIENEANTHTEVKSLATEESGEESSEDCKLLNGDCGSVKSIENQSLPSTKDLETLNNFHSVHSNFSPRSHKSPSQKRFAVETDASSMESPKRSMKSLRFENSPISSPNSRTNQMMELVKQETERTISSSPNTSCKKRRILPIRIGPVTPSPISQLAKRKHQGPSETWVCRTYSPTASPNSSILKRNYQQTSHLISPESSPPSSKKKRVSFLDPPVSESLYFCKSHHGRGKIRRSRSKDDDAVDLASDAVDLASDEELPSQGSVGVELPVFAAGQSEARVFSPLQDCSSPLTDILERIVNLQWMSELEAQLERLGVTTIGQLSSLPEETVERLPFIPPKLERLRKILQNYYNEINGKPADPMPVCSGTKEGHLSPGTQVPSTTCSGTKEGHLSPGTHVPSTTCSGTKEGRLSPKAIPTPDCSETKEVFLSPAKDDSKAEVSDKMNVEDTHNEIEEIARVEESHDISVIAENMKQKLESHPELINQLIDKLPLKVVMTILDLSVDKLKKEIGKS